MSTDFLQRIDWHHHDGVNLPMIKDFMRNQFYDRILKRYVGGQECTDIGFGTGLLSMIALKHGAKHIRAFESDSDRYQLGREIIQHLGLGDQIELVHGRYSRKDQLTPITFTETVNGNLWWEGLWNTLPSDTNTVFLPGEYFLEIWAVVVPEKFAQGLCRNAIEQPYFNPGIDIDTTFINVINQYINATPVIESPLPEGIVQFERQRETDWGWIPYQRAVQAGKIVAKYTANRHDPDLTHYELSIDTQDWRNECVLLVPRAGMKQDNDILYLDTGHWGPTENPILLVRPKNDITVMHGVRDGEITYSLKN